MKTNKIKNKPGYLMGENIEIVLSAITVSLLVIPILLTVIENYASRQSLISGVVMMIASLFILRKYSDNEYYTEINFEGDFNRFSSIIHKETGLQISSKIGNHYIFKSQYRIFPNFSYTVLDLGNCCKIFIRNSELKEFNDALNKPDLAVNSELFGFCVKVDSCKGMKVD